MKITAIGGGPAALFFGILMKKADPRHEVTILERNKPDDTFGFGVVFSDATLDNVGLADAESYGAIKRSFAHWDDIDVHYRGTKITSRGHGFSGLSRVRLLNILQRRAEALGVGVRYQTEVRDLEPYLDADLVLGADGVNSLVRERWAERFAPAVDFRPNRFVWLGTTFPYPAFTFYFKEDDHGLWRVHAYRYAPDQSTFILETTEECWRKAGMDRATEEETVTFAEKLFADELRGHPLLRNRSLWRSFPIVKCGSWHHDNVVLVGDACHTAHFSIGSGTKLAMEDAIALRDAVLAHADVPTALAAYEAARRPIVESTQRAALTSLAWFEQTERHMRLEPVQFAFSLLTRSLRVTHMNLKLRDPALVQRVDTWFAEKAGVASTPPPPPMFTPYTARGCTLDNRVVVSPMCMYSAEDGIPNDWHLVHLGSRAVGGAGLVFAEATGVSPEARITPGCAGLWSERHATAWKRVTDFVHQRTGAKIGIQLAHAGRKSATCIPWQGGYDEPLPSGAWPICSASPIPFTARNQIPREMKRADMDRVRADFARAAALAVDAGFDWVELHMAHGYLLSCFLSPLANHRSDEYGGTIDNRLRLPLEVFDAVRAAWPAERPISVRISATEWAEGGTTPEDLVAIGRAFKAHGCDLIDVSAGGVVEDAKPEYGRLYQTPFSELIRLEAGIPTMTVGAITSYTDVNSILAAGRADLCVLARGHLWDPYYTRHAARELGVELPWPDPYHPLARFNPRFI
jgi:anthraniloyl-CoA monooxygenase